MGIMTGLLGSCLWGTRGIRAGRMMTSKPSLRSGFDCRPASLSLAGLTLWPNWLVRWLATLGLLSTQVRNPVGLLLPGRYTHLVDQSYFENIKWKLYLGATIAMSNVMICERRLTFWELSHNGDIALLARHASKGLAGFVFCIFLILSGAEQPNKWASACHRVDYCVGVKGTGHCWAVCLYGCPATVCLCGLRLSFSALHRYPTRVIYCHWAHIGVRFFSWQQFTSWPVPYANSREW